MHICIYVYVYLQLKGQTNTHTYIHIIFSLPTRVTTPRAPPGSEVGQTGRARVENSLGRAGGSVKASWREAVGLKARPALIFPGTHETQLGHQPDGSYDAEFDSD